VVTHPSTSLTIVCLSMGERTGSRAFRHLWSYVQDEDIRIAYDDGVLGMRAVEHRFFDNHLRRVTLDSFRLVTKLYRLSSLYCA
jgi:hypothetical protein